MSHSSNEFGVEQELEPLARGQLAAAVLRLDPLGAAARPRRSPLFFQAVENVVHDASRQ